MKKKGGVRNTLPHPQLPQGIPAVKAEGETINKQFLVLDIKPRLPSIDCLGGKINLDIEEEIELKKKR